MSVELDPPELGFQRPFSHEVSQVLRLSNPHTQSVAFKVKTTAPKQYCVRPNSGRIEAAGTVEVQVLLQAMKEDPPLDAKCRDKFLVQSVLIPTDAVPNASITQIWQGIEATAKGSIQEKKIRVTFLSAEGHVNGVVGGSTAPLAAAAATSHEDQPPAYTAPASSSSAAAAAAAVTPQKSAPLAGEKSPSLLDQSMASVQSATETIQNTAVSGATAVANAVPTSSEELKQQLQDAKNQIARLQTQAAEGLRQRKIIDGPDSKTSGNPGLAVQNQSAPGGVSIQVVAGLCLFCFLIAYLFF